MKKGRVQRAKCKFKTVIRIVGLQGPGRSAFSHLNRLHDEGITRLEQAKQLAKAGQYRQALQLARQTKTRYANLFGGIRGARHMPNVAREAVAIIGTIEADPAAQTCLQEYEAAKRFSSIELLHDKARKDPAKYLDLFKKLETIANRFPDCPTGRECASRLRDITGDRKLYKLIKKEERRRRIAAALQQAERYQRQGLHDHAAAEYEKLAKKFPGKTIKQLRRLAAKPTPQPRS